MDRRRFAKDEDANAFFTFLQLALLILIPLGLIWAVWAYRKKHGITDEEAQPAVGGPKAEPASALEGPMGRVPGAKKCSRCGFAVKQYRTAMGGLCPNCGFGLS